MELTTIPVIVLMITLASQNRSPGVWELIIFLIIALIFLGANRLPDIAKGLDESIRNFKAGVLGEQRQQSENTRLLWLLVFALFAAAIIFPVLGFYGFSDEQKLVLTIVLLGWIGVGYWSFGRTLRK